MNNPVLNVGFLGHVAHGKSTLAHALSGKKTNIFAKEKERGISIKLGYANVKLYKNGDSYGSDHILMKSNILKGDIKYIDSLLKRGASNRIISIVDCPGHEMFQSTAIAGSTIMDTVILVIAINQEFPQPQTVEHVKIIKSLNLTQLVIAQTKIDLARDIDKVIEQKKQISHYIKEELGFSPTIIPISAQRSLKSHKDYNLSSIIKYLYEYPLPQRNNQGIARIIRSFDINKPGTNISDLKGGVIGVALTGGSVCRGDELELRPGLIYSNGTYKPMNVQVTSLHTEKVELTQGYPGGLLGVGTNIDPSLTAKDRIIGQLLGKPNLLPQVYKIIVIKIRNKKFSEYDVRCTINGSPINGKIRRTSHHKVMIELDKPMAMFIDSYVGISIVKGKYLGLFRFIGGDEAQRVP